jgi:hypothetical protein
MLRDFRIAGLVLMAFGLVGCDSSEDVVTDRTPTGIESSPVQLQAQPMKYLPYGVPIPPEQEITAPPEPYDPIKHGPAVPNTMPAANLAKIPGSPRPDVTHFRARHRFNKSGDASRPAPVTGNAGFWLDYERGVYTTNDIQLNVSLPAPPSGQRVDIYAPTTLPPNSACIEMFTAHFRTSTHAKTFHQHGWYDFCGAEDFVFLEDIELPEWQDKYVRIQDGEKRSYSIVQNLYLQYPTCWYARLYNFRLGQWETKYTYCGSPRNPRPRGWTQWESHNIDLYSSCPFIPGIRASYIQTFGSDGIWRNMRYETRQTTNGPCFTAKPQANFYTFRHTDGFSPKSWQAFTPNGS